VYAYYIDRIREQLHIALAFSPIGDSFKERIRVYPSLINCCTIDWYMPWPEEALSRVGVYFVTSMHLNRPHGEEQQEQVQVKDPADPDQEEVVRRETVDGDRELTQLEADLVDCVMYFHQSVVDFLFPEFPGCCRCRVATS